MTPDARATAESDPPTGSTPAGGGAAVPDPDQQARARQRLNVDPERYPRHIAIVMDGNGRWANRRDKPRTFGHARGAECVSPIVTECVNLGRIEALTLYALSSENLLRRPSEEIDFLMDLYCDYLAAERQVMLRNNVRFAHYGRREGLAESVLREIDITREQTAANTGLVLGMALNYGARQELTDAIQRLAADVAAGRLHPDQIDTAAIDRRLYTAEVCDPDLLIRTAGECRLSNFLLWQVSYAEIHITDTLWPEFNVDRLHDALRDFATRTRRFGAVVK